MSEQTRKPNGPERRLWKSGPVIGSIGIGTWAIGGPFWSGDGCRYPTGAPLGYGDVDDDQSLRAIRCAIDHGARFFDTADAYGTGHAERILGQALKHDRSSICIATKFGNTYDDASRTLTGTDVSADYIRWSCEASLQRLQTDWIDLYQLHLGDLSVELALDVADTLDRLCEEGKIRSYAWSTDTPDNAACFGRRPNAVAVQFDMNVFQDARDMLDACEAQDLTGIIRSPLAMGFLSGRHRAGGQLPDNDIRSKPPGWLQYFNEGGGIDAKWAKRLENITDVLTSGGRTPAQGALAWIWARHDRAFPIPGVRTEAQVRENLGAVEFGPLTHDQMDEIDRLLDRPCGHHQSKT